MCVFFMIIPSSDARPPKALQKERFKKNNLPSDFELATKPRRDKLDELYEWAKKQKGVAGIEEKLRAEAELKWGVTASTAEGYAKAVVLRLKRDRGEA